VKQSVIASTLLAAPEGLDVAPVLKLVDSGKVAKEAIEDIVNGMEGGKGAEEAAKGFMLMSDSEVKKKILEIVKANKGANFGQLMGMAMSQLRGKADAQTVKKLIEELS
jgi:glutamyl-tRNA(Gln) amidotransferase subunit E